MNTIGASFTRRGRHCSDSMPNNHQFLSSTFQSSSFYVPNPNLFHFHLPIHSPCRSQNCTHQLLLSLYLLCASPSHSVQTFLWLWLFPVISVETTGRSWTIAIDSTSNIMFRQNDWPKTKHASSVEALLRCPAFFFSTHSCTSSLDIQIMHDLCP